MTLNLSSLTDKSCNPRQLSPLTLAFIGDTVYDLFVRESLVVEANRSANMLHKSAVERVRASAQANAAKRLMDENILTEEEVSVLKRGRNAHSRHLPKNANEADYHLATGLEALFGYLYLSGNDKRLNEIFDLITLWFHEEHISKS